MIEEDIRHYLIYFFVPVGFIYFGVLFHIAYEINKTFLCWEFFVGFIILISSFLLFAQMIFVIEESRRNPKQRSNK